MFEYSGHSPHAGFKRQLPDHRDRLLSLPLIARADQQVDTDLRPNMPPIYDQLQIGACTGNTGAGVYHYELLKANYKWGMTPARLFAYYNARLIEGTTDTDAGATIRDLFKGLATYGICPEVETDGTDPGWLFPYIDNGVQFKTKPSDACYKDAVLHTALEYESVPQTDQAIKTLLMQGIPVAMGFSVPDTFMTQQMASTGVMQMPGWFSRVVGGHANIICGDFINKAFGNQGITEWYIMRNSWGANWGMAGYWVAPKKFILDPNHATDFWAVTKIGFKPQVLARS